MILEYLRNAYLTILVVVAFFAMMFSNRKGMLEKESERWILF